jgi:hypothetical protein
MNQKKVGDMKAHPSIVKSPLNKTRSHLHKFLRIFKST